MKYAMHIVIVAALALTLFGCRRTLNSSAGNSKMPTTQSSGKETGSDRQKESKKQNDGKQATPPSHSGTEGSTNPGSGGDTGSTPPSTKPETGGTTKPDAEVPPASKPDSSKITLTVGDIQTILGKSAESDGKTFKIGGETEMSATDIVFKASALQDKTPEITLSSDDPVHLRLNQNKKTGKLPLRFKTKPATLYIQIAGMGFTPVKLKVILERAESSTPSTPGTTPSEGILTARDVLSVLGHQASADGSFNIGNATSMAKTDIVFKPKSYAGKQMPEVQDIWYTGKSGEVRFGYHSQKLELKTDDTEITLYIQIKQNKDFKNKSRKFTVTLKRQ